MSNDLISAGTRNEFREVLSGYVLREIGDIFASGGFKPRLDYDPQVPGQRRTLVEQYFADIDLADPGDMQRLLLVFEELLFRAEQNAFDQEQAQKTRAKLLGRMQRDGFEFANGRFTSSKLSNPAITTPHLTALTKASISNRSKRPGRRLTAIRQERSRMLTRWWRICSKRS